MKKETLKAAVELTYTLQIVRKDLETLRKQDAKEKKIVIPMTNMSDTVFDMLMNITRWLEQEEELLLARLEEL